MWFALGTLSRWLVFAGLLLLVGSLTFRFFVLGRGNGEPRPGTKEGVARARAAARTGAVAARLVILGAAGRLAAQLAVFRDPFEPVLSELKLLVTATTWGRAWLLQAGGALVALIGLRMARGRGRPSRASGWTLAGVATLALVFTPALSGHALGTERWTSAAVLADAAHVFAAGVWLGSLATLALLVAGSRRAGDPVPAGTIVAWIGAFSPLALASAATLGATGLFASWLHLGAVSSLWTSSYGRWLSLKLGLLLVVVGCGYYNWKRSRERVEASGEGAGLPGTVGVELGTAVLILLVTAILVATPMPGEGG